MLKRQNNTKIVLNRQSDLILDNAEITSPVGIVLGDIAGAQDAISDAVSAEEAERISGDAKLQEGLTKEEGQRVIAESAEEAARIAGDADLQSQMDNVISNINPAALDSLSEIVGAFQTADGDINNAITTLANAASSDLSDESARAIAAEAKLTSDLSDEVAARIADVDTEEARAKVAEAKLTSDLSSEEVARIAAVDAEYLRANDAEALLTSDLSDEVANRIAAVDAEYLRATDAEEQLGSDLSDEVANRIADVDAEEARALAAEAGLKSDINVEKGRIDAILDGSDVNLDQFKEVVAFVESIDMTNDNALLTAVSGINDSISIEVSRAKAAESKLTSDLGTESARAIAAEDGLTTDLGIEVARAKAAEGALDAAYKAADVSMDAAYKAADSSLQSNINTEATERLAADNTIQANLDAETLRAQGAEAGLSSDLSDEVDARIADVNAEEVRAIAAEGVLTSDLGVEKSRAIAAEGVLTSDLGIEVARAKAAEVKLTSDLGTEKSRAEGAEGVLQGNINTEKGRIDSILLASDADKDSFAEIVTLINSVDTTNDEAFAGYVLSNNAALSAEVSRSMAAEAGLSSDLSDEAVRAISAEADLSADLSTETVDRIAGDATGAAALSDQRDLMFANFNTTNSNLNALTDRTEAADAKLTSDLSSEVTNRVAGDAALQLSLDNEVADRTAADQAIQANLDAETARATAAEGVLTSNLSDEVANRIDAINELDTKSSDGLNTEIARSMAAEAVLTADLGTETARAIAAEAKLTSDLSSETARAIAAEDVLTSDLSDEVANRIDAVSTEESDRIAGDEYLQSQMDNVISNIDPDALDSLTEIVAAFQTADGDINNAITVLAESASNGLNAEVDRATGAEENLVSDLSDEITRAEEAEEQLGSDLSDEITRAEEAEGGIITMVGYENMNTYTQGLWNEFGDQLANSADGLAQANQELTNVQGFIAQAETVLNDGNTSYPVEVTFGDGDNAWTETFESQRGLDSLLRSFYEKRDYAYRTINYLSNIDGEQNLANFEGWLNLRTSRDINETAQKFWMELKETQNKLVGLIDAEKVRAEEVEDEIITTVGYDEMGAIASGDYDAYKNEVSSADSIVTYYPAKIQEANDSEAVLVAAMSDNIFPVTIEGSEYADADSLQVAIDKVHVQADKMIDELNSSAEFLSNFAPVNIVNFESWVDFNRNLDNADADSSIIRAVGYDKMGTIASRDFLTYRQEVGQAQKDVVNMPSKIDSINEHLTSLNDAMSNSVYPVTVNGNDYVDADSLQVAIDKVVEQLETAQGYYDNALAISSNFAPVNIVNFESWVDYNLDAAISAEIERAMKAEAGLDSKIVDIISNTDITSIDSFSEVVADVDFAVAIVNYNAAMYVIDNRPTMLEFNETPDGSGTTFNAPVIMGTHIVFLNGLMQFEGRDYVVGGRLAAHAVASADRTAARTTTAKTAAGKTPYHADEQSLSIEFYTAPEATDVLNVYGVQTGTEMNAAMSLAEIAEAAADATEPTV